jgi:hypothetical protein
LIEAHDDKTTDKARRAFLAAVEEAWITFSYIAARRGRERWNKAHGVFPAAL